MQTSQSIDLEDRLRERLKGKVLLVGIGNTLRGDDGLGPKIIEALDGKVQAELLDVGEVPESYTGRIISVRPDTIVLIDAVDFGGAPGSAVFLNAGEMAARFPQISTHKISLSVLAQWAEANGTTRVWLLGVQPESLKSQQQLTPTLQNTLELLCDLLKTGTDRVGTGVLAHPCRAKLGSELEVNA